MTDQEKFTMDLLSVDEILTYLADNRVDGLIGCYGYRDKFDCPELGSFVDLKSKVTSASATFSQFPNQQARQRAILAMCMFLKEEIFSELQEDD